ncbi:MAG: hypothetical protein ACI4LE_09810, partial [Faecalibacterium sp.]
PSQSRLRRDSSPKGRAKNRPAATRAQPPRAGARKPVPPVSRLPNIPSRPSRKAMGAVKSFSVPFFKKEQKEKTKRSKNEPL